jgi:serine/threonine-protein kinase
MPELPLVGTEFAGYGLRAVLGRGGMSIVYQAENPRLRNLIALKVLAPELADDQVFRTRFREESQIAASLNHPHVIPIHDFGSSDGLLYIAMRYVSGTDLRHLIAERGWLAPDAAVHLLAQAARALDAAHRRGLVHRDVKPGNLLIAQGIEDGDPDHLYLADFGITKHVGGRTGLTVAGMMLGTVHYASPEQIQDLPVAGPADQYSLGCVLYECLTGRAPFEKSSNEAIMWAHVHEFAAPPSLLRPGLPPAVDEVFARVLAKDPDERYADCREFIAAARGALDRTPITRPPQEPTANVRPAAGPRQEVAGWPYFPDATSGPRGRLARRRRPAGRGAWSVLSLAAVAIVAAGGTAAGLLATQAGPAATQTRQLANTPSAPPSQLFSILGKTERFTSMLRMSTCAQTTATLVECTDPDPAIASVTFATYPSLAALYTKYQEIVGNLTGKSFGSVENVHVCGALAPNPTAENTWNHTDQYLTKYPVTQLASGKVPDDAAMGRVFCEQTPNGSEYIVWTQDYGHLLGYATGAASHEQVWNWFYMVHHNITFPGQTMAGRPG